MLCPFLNERQDVDDKDDFEFLLLCKSQTDCVKKKLVSTNI